MRILHIQAQLPAKTGSGVYFSNVIKGLQEHEQACIYGMFGEFSYDLISKENQYPVVFPNEECDFPLPGMSDVMPYESTVYGEMTEEMIAQWQNVFRKKIHQAVTDFQPEVIFCHHLWFLTDLVREEIPQLPVFAFCHGTDIRQARQHPHLFKKYVQNLSKLDQVFALSHLQIADIHQLYGVPKDKIFVLGGGFDPEIFYPPAKKTEKDEIEILYAGKISEAKGVFTLAQVFADLTKRHPEVRLHLIGNAAGEAKERLAPYLDNPQIMLYNVANQQQLADEFRKGDLFVLPSYYEGLGLVAIEALACDMRVVITDIPALKEQLGSVVNDSGVISYVPLPRVRNQDEPYEEDLPQYYHDLEVALETQLQNIKAGKKITKVVEEAILKSSWPQLIEKVEEKLSTIK
ncbi:glycosyltransferase family 4 protein [Enterococcus pingfangensis]|uniref:glycosyltransferase family 4 protein n=1 Tax=Enterococcus pingfangensis TaxID=2559924 RepID=UPI0010F73FDD|nr:glycosyltransferase family 4 protein [Enterococcus pingfangensis]